MLKQLIIKTLWWIVRYILSVVFFIYKSVMYVFPPVCIRMHMYALIGICFNGHCILVALEEHSALTLWVRACRPDHVSLSDG